jgi:hypothetical protein
MNSRQPREPARKERLIIQRHSLSCLFVWFAGTTSESGFIAAGTSLALDWKFRRRGNAALPSIGRADLPVRRNFAADQRSDVGGLAGSVEKDSRTRGRGAECSR